MFTLHFRIEENDYHIPERVSNDNEKQRNHLSGPCSVHFGFLDAHKIRTASRVGKQHFRQVPGHYE